ncbi:MAG: bifunctional diaminohydroxyphosphoribosylaminopyrimidine deaminase/5-amino-6-(5-phosphoribosylamino)uracil reductase RibD [Calditrichia bacterium]|nr:bifunctional diaminohydroxyphosphoribosylaminopyrimidine deaminase/5-amino-6-(5-phosphoribosylamino)uracil reductase RibD [Calditrichia bacterium]
MVKPEKNNYSENDIKFIQRTFELALKGRGKTSPNPNVGCVIVKNRKIIAEGNHKKFGDKHAEIDAIDKAAESVEGATLYCNLEPCCDGIPEKKTPPCTERIIKEKIAKVVISIKDSNPHVNGKGIKELQNAGIEVVTGIEEEKAYKLNEAYFKYIATGLPFVHLKIAQTLDGRIATAIGHSQWISNDLCRDEVQEIRYQSDAILVGLNTVLKDNPRLTQRKYPGKQPYRIILDDSLSSPLDSNVLKDEFSSKTIVFTSSSHKKEILDKFQKTGAEIVIVNVEDDGNLNLNEILKELGNRKIANLMVEGGAQVLTAFIKEKLVDKITIFIAPKILGKGIETIGDLQITHLNNSFEFKTEEIRNVDGQVMWALYPVLED